MMYLWRKREREGINHIRIALGWWWTWDYIRVAFAGTTGRQYFFYLGPLYVDVGLLDTTLFR